MIFLCLGRGRLLHGRMPRSRIRNDCVKFKVENCFVSGDYEVALAMTALGLKEGDCFARQGSEKALAITRLVSTHNGVFLNSLDIFPLDFLDGSVKIYFGQMCLKK